MKQVLIFLITLGLMSACATSSEIEGELSMDKSETASPVYSLGNITENLLMAKATVVRDICDYCEPQYETVSFLDDIAERCDFQNGINYYVMDGFPIYDINTKDLSYQIRENHSMFLLMREDQVYSHYYSYNGQGKHTNDGVDVLTQVFKEKADFAMIATGESAWIITETNQYLFENNSFETASISKETVDYVRKTILKNQTSSFKCHKVIPEEVAKELNEYEQRRLEAEKNFEFPSGTLLMKDLFQDEIDDMFFTVYAMNGDTYVMDFTDDKMNEILSELENLELTTDFEKQHGAGGERIEMRLTSLNGWTVTYTERTNELTIEAAKDQKKMTYALVDNGLRERGIFLSLMEELLEGSQKKVNNGTFDVLLIPANVYRGEYRISGDVSVYAYPYQSIEGIDFSEFTIYCDGQRVNEISVEPGEHLLNLFVGDDEYMLKYFVE